ncbi:MAG: tRNA pseudouridine(55) synthase TruB [Candidatus Fimivicinus sp.]|nr:tRNA pseudouridine(55) synthase TruB [Oscillospiraceae bacterium]MDY5590226.1 tRNA pseudouridine(55) synthase TruB [Candidatus Fimivicinus sp.]
MTGIICLDKQEHMTSFSAVARARRITGEKKAGHAGTLDPMATGILPVLFGGATRFMEFLPVHDKGYRARIQLGMTTDTLDTTGTVLTRSGVRVSKAQVEQALAAFRGDILQVPPMYSALSKNGVRLYELARRGEEVERQARPVTIYRLELTEFDGQTQECTLYVLCSKGTYIRSLADDLGRMLGCGAVMSGLRRTYAAGFSLKDCVTLDTLSELAQQGKLSQCMIPLERVLAAYPSLSVTQAQAVRFANGGALDADRLRFAEKRDGLFRVYSPDERFLGLGELLPEERELKVRRVFQET